MSHYPNKIIRIFIYLISLFGIGLVLWTNKYFGKVSLDQALSTIYFSMQGALASDPIFIKRFIEWCLFWPAIVTLAIGFVSKIVHFVVIVISKLRSNKWIIFFIYHYFHFILLSISLLLIVYQFDIVDYVKHKMRGAQDYFAVHYINPDQVNIKAEHPKNLLLIYVESLETTYSNAALFRNDLLKRLTSLNLNNVSFKQYEQMPGTGWSIAGIVSTQCGVPLKLVTMLGANSIGEKATHFLSGTTCLGDILAKNGYQNIYMNGSNVDFAGVGNFFKEHHYQEVYGREYWLQTGVLHQNEMTNWGMPDDMLLEQAKIKLTQLMKSHKRFNLTLFTIDTHGESGQLSKTCANSGYHNFEGIVECTANLVADLIYYCNQQGWLDNMDIVVIGDHLAMKNLVSKTLEQAEHRYIFNMIVSKNPLKKNTNHVVHFDFFPTILTALGFKIDGNHLALGYSGVGEGKYSPNTNRFLDMKQNIPYESATYDNLWMPHVSH